MKKITKLTFYAVGILAITKATQFIIRKKIEHNIAYSIELIEKNKIKNSYERKYIDITEVTKEKMNKEKVNCKK